MKQKKSNEEIMEVFSKLTNGEERESEYIRNSIQTHIRILIAHLIDGLEHREIDKIVLGYPVDEKGKVRANGSVSSRILFWLGLKGQGRSIFLGILQKQSLDEVIVILEKHLINDTNERKLNLILNFFKMAKLLDENNEFRELLEIYDAIHLKKVQSLKKITKKMRTSDLLLKVLLESRATLEQHIELNEMHHTLNNMLADVISVIETESLVDYESEVTLFKEYYHGYIEGAFKKNGLTIEGKVLTEVKAPSRESESKTVAPKKSSCQPIKRDYTSEQIRNKAIGDAAEILVLKLEREKLINSGKPDLAKEVDHVSKTRGDGLGYDIKSYDVNGEEIYIEVKGTINPKNTSFFISAAEVDISRKYPNQFYLYRVYDLNSKNPKYFKVKGDLIEHFKLVPTEYLASI